MMSFFSQSIVSNAGTRGLDSFAKWVYVDTEIDRQLKSAILLGGPSLVIITGNAGDGKTAFIRGLESELAGSQGAVVERARGGNGSIVRTPSHNWVTNWDGSQDENGLDNTDVLDEFFGPFEGDTISPAANETYVIAINEGRLVDFLEEKASKFPELNKHVNNLFASGPDKAPDWLVLVNLNRRVLTADGVNNLVAELLNRMSDERIWSPCSTCPAVASCPSYANAAVLRDPVLGAGRLRESAKHSMSSACDAGCTSLPVTFSPPSRSSSWGIARVATSSPTSSQVRRFHSSSDTCTTACSLPVSDELAEGPPRIGCCASSQCSMSQRQPNRNSTGSSGSWAWSN